MIDVRLPENARTFRPGQSIDVEVTWSYEKPLKFIDLALSWYTEGKGDTDAIDVLTAQWRDLDQRGTRTWQIEIPRGPLSLEGVLISIRWNLTVEANPANDEKVIPILISHFDTPIRSFRKTVEK